MAERDVGHRRGLLKGVEVDDDHVDGSDAVSGDGGFVFLIAANVKQAAMNLGVERLDAAIKHLWKAGEFADVLDREAGLAQCLCGSASRDQFDAKTGKHAGKVHQSGLVSDAQQGSTNLFCIVGARTHGCSPQKK